MGKLSSLAAKAIAVIFIIGASFYQMKTGKSLSIDFAFSILLIGVGIANIFLAVDISMIIKNIKELKKAVSETTGKIIDGFKDQ